MKNLYKIAAVLLSLSFLFLTACNNNTSEETTTQEPLTGETFLSENTTLTEETTLAEDTTIAEETTAQAPETTTQEPETTTKAPETTTKAPETTTKAPETTTKAPETTTKAPETTTKAPETTTQAQKTDYSSYTKAQICELYVNAVNKTKDYTSNVSVHHKESFDFEVTECVGGDLVAFCVNNLLGLVVKPTDSTYYFSNGVATNEDGETVPLLLPASGDCVLPANGAATATINEENGLTHIYIVLKEEHTGMGEVPPYNAGAVGFLDTASFTFNILEIKEADIGYTGTEIDAYLTSDGKIDKVTYTINLSSSGTGTGLGITGNASVVGSQTEMWDIQW